MTPNGPNPIHYLFASSFLHYQLIIHFTFSIPLAQTLAERYRVVYVNPQTLLKHILLGSGKRESIESKFFFPFLIVNHPSATHDAIFFNLRNYFITAEQIPPQICTHPITFVFSIQIPKQ